LTIQVAGRCHTPPPRKLACTGARTEDQRSVWLQMLLVSGNLSLHQLGGGLHRLRSARLRSCGKDINARPGSVWYYGTCSLHRFRLPFVAPFPASAHTEGLRAPYSRFPSAVPVGCLLIMWTGPGRVGNAGVARMHQRHLRVRKNRATRYICGSGYGYSVHVRRLSHSLLRASIDQRLRPRRGKVMLETTDEGDDNGVSEWRERNQRIRPISEKRAEAIAYVD